MDKTTGGLTYWLALRDSWTTKTLTQRRRLLETLPQSESARVDWWLVAEARDKQIPPPGAWPVCMWMTGRGWGKTRTGAEEARRRVVDEGCKRLALVAPTAADARDVMVEGESGVLSVCRRVGLSVLYEPSKRRITWPDYGAIATTYSADEPERLRGPQHDFAWCDELAAWRYPEAWDMLMLGLRLGANPQCIVTTTPKPRRIIRQLIEDSAVVVIRGATYENRANLAPAFFSQIVRAYEDTTLGQQEIYGELLTDMPGALWTRDLIQRAGEPEELDRIVVAIDPAGSMTEDSDETGIVVAGMLDDRLYVLEDASGRYTPKGWARRAIDLYERWEADRIVAETNFGGDMVQATLEAVQPGIPFTKVTASRGKKRRAEPVAAVYEQGRAFHCGVFRDLEDQMCSFTEDADWSPDRMDALVWAARNLLDHSWMPRVVSIEL